MKDISQLCVQESTMIKVMSFYFSMRTRHVYGWVSIIWLLSAVSVAVSEGMELKTDPEMIQRCGENVTLTCEVNSLNQVEIVSFEWLAINGTRSKTMCPYEVNQTDPEVVCERIKTPHHRLTLTLLNVMPVNQGNYSCKLRSKQGAKFAKTVVTVQDCSGSSNSSIRGSHSNCWFSGVYPRGIVHWFQGDDNLTDSTSTQEERDQHGLYNVSSTIVVQKGNSSLPYKCSLWIPSAGKYLTSHELPLTGGQETPTSSPSSSSGNIVTLQWVSIVVEIMMVKFML